MNMSYQIGDFLGYEPVECPSVPLPKRWYMLRTFPGREARVMKAFRLRGISGYLPVMQHQQDFRRYDRGREWIERRNVISPLIQGVVLIPDFEERRNVWKTVDGTAGILQFGAFTPSLTPKLFRDIQLIECIGNTPKSKREHKFNVGQLGRVVSGPFAWFAARVERIDTGGRLSVGVEIFGRITPVDIDESDFEAV